MDCRLAGVSLAAVRELFHNILKVRPLLPCSSPFQVVIGNLLATLESALSIVDNLDSISESLFVKDIWYSLKFRQLEGRQAWLMFTTAL